MDDRIKILLPSERGLTSENVDLYLNLDLKNQFREFKKDRFDNDFDLAAQFSKERNNSKNFIVYGEVSSTVIHCDDIEIEIHSDAERTNLLATIRTTKISYDMPNVFGKKKGKYHVKLSSYEFDSVYFRINSNRLSYRDQLWDQRLVFRDSDGEIVPYGTQTVDVNFDGISTTIDNDFPFFFNKHWIKNNYDIIEEKRAKISFNVASQTLTEGQSGSVQVLLNKPSPFGLELAKVSMLEDNSFSDFILGQSVSDVDGGAVANIITSDPDLTYLNGFARIVVTVPADRLSLIRTGSPIRILSGSYAGYYSVLLSFPFVQDGALVADTYYIALDAPYSSSGTNEESVEYRLGTLPDITFYMDGNEIDFPINLFWQEGETIKTIDFQVNDDFEVEFPEYVILSLGDLSYVDEGRFMHSRITYENTTPRRSVELFL